MKIKEKFIDSTMATDIELAGESTARENADTSHQTQINTLTNNLASEVIRATDSENLIVSKLNTKYFISKTTDENTASTSVYSTYLSLVTPSLPLADYTVMLDWQASTSNANRTADFRITVNGAVVYTRLSFSSTANGQHEVSKFIKLDAVSGIQTINIQYKVSGSGTTLTMREAQISLNRTGF